MPFYRSFSKAEPVAGATILRGSAGLDPVRDFARSAVAGLSASPRRLECRFLYDELGSALYERITEQPEYYLTRTEAAILAANAPRIRKIAGPATLVELGSGSSVKTDYLLRSWLAEGRPVRYIPVDVSESALRGACRTITTTHRGVRVTGVHADYPTAFPLFRRLSPALVLFLGSTIGNFAPEEMSCFLAALSAALAPGDFFLVGLDLVKEHDLIHEAYNDAAGVTAEFTRNLFARMNRELGSNIDVGFVEHVARYSPEREQVEICARFTRRQTIRVAPLGTSFTIAGGEEVQTEVSRKFRLGEFIPYLEGFGFTTEEIFTDERNWFALALLRRSSCRESAAGGGMK
jgi:L-histidine N-alpha-methyltransferase